MADFTTLRSTAFNAAYYEEHRAAGLDYAHYGDWQFRYCRWLHDAIQLPAAARVLDVGCACGNLVQGFHDQGLSAHGIDPNEYTIQLGRERFPAIADRLHVCDASNLHPFSLQPSAFSLVHSMQAAEHWPVGLVPQILRELRRVTRPAGLFWCVLDTAELERRQGRDLASEDPTHVCIRPLAWWHAQLRAAGWELCGEEFRMRLVEHGWSYFDSHDWDWWLARPGPFAVPDRLLCVDEDSARPAGRRNDWFVREESCFADHNIIQEVYHGNCYELAAEWIPPGGIVVDVGAHIGTFARLVHQLQPTSQIHCVEVHPRNVGPLWANVGEFATIHHAALTYLAEPCLLGFAGSANTGVSQICDPAAWQAMPDNPWVRREPRPASTLTLEGLLEREQLPHIDVLKLDCEGSEWDILERCGCLDRVGRIVGEYHGPERVLWDIVARRLPADRWHVRHKRNGEGLGLFWATREA